VTPAHLASTDYSWSKHDAWLFGTTDGRQPRWLGYSLAYEIVRRWLAATGAIDGETWINVPTHAVITTARRAWTHP
jgi:uncharacterized protein YjaZ